MRFETFSRAAGRALALAFAFALPLAAAHASGPGVQMDDGGAAVAQSCADKPDVTTQVPARPSENWVAQLSDWKDSGVIIDSCHTAVITAAGQWRYGPGNGQPLMNGAGARNRPCGMNFKTGMHDSPMPTAPCGALIGKIGANGTPFLVGAGPTVVPPGAEGKLYFIMNDWEYGDNEGALDVTTSFKPAVR